MIGNADLKIRLGLVTCATFAALGLFILIGPSLLSAFGTAADVYGGQLLTCAFLLNIALILFGWIKSKDLRNALEARAEAERQVHEHAYRDHITGLWNSRHLVETIGRLAAHPHGKATLALIDLDHFKNVNDLYGHPTGDRLLAQVAAILTEGVPAAACCARLGGDEFAILLEGAQEPGRVLRMAERLVGRLAQPIPLEETTAHISASVGIATLDDGMREPNVLMRHADIAMYEAKRLGRNRVVQFDGAMERQLVERNQLEAEMRAGIDRGEFLPFYQPLIDLSTGAMIGFEVLARWKHPDRGLIEPNDFIPVAEASCLISQLSMSVMRQALAEARSWPPDTTLAVNISPVQFKDPLLAQRILQLLVETGFPARRLEIEITETSLLDDQELVLATVQSLRNSGISISLDDFGTGYASLAQLKALPFDRIKIDRSFVAALLEDEQSNAIVNTIAGLGQSLRLPITAEGVETERVKEQLQSIGCSNGQGWLFGRPVPGDAISLMIERQKGEQDQLQRRRPAA